MKFKINTEHLIRLIGFCYEAVSSLSRSTGMQDLVFRFKILIKNLNNLSEESNSGEVYLQGEDILGSIFLLASLVNAGILKTSDPFLEEFLVNFYAEYFKNKFKINNEQKAGEEQER